MMEAYLLLPTSMSTSYAPFFDSFSNLEKTIFALAREIVGAF
jgi:hypothetical protein